MSTVKRHNGTNTYDRLIYRQYFGFLTVSVLYAPRIVTKSNGEVLQKRCCFTITVG